ncbi:MAG: LysE family translocator [Proteobacteria bacterium]|nr:LysE family translocator [Pseudomonadota bacterium]
MDQLVAFTLLVTLVVMSPGPNFVLVMNTAVRRGAGAGIANTAGIALAFFVHGALIIYGLSAVMLLVPSLFLVFKIAGSLYLIWLGLKALWSLRDEITTRSRAIGSRRAFFEGLVTNLLNPKVSAFYIAALPAYMATPEFSGVLAFKLVSIHSIVSVAWFCLVAVTVSAYRDRLASVGVLRVLKALGAAAMLFFGIRLLGWKPQSAI